MNKRTAKEGPIVLVDSLICSVFRVSCLLSFQTPFNSSRTVFIRTRLYSSSLS